MFLHLKMYGVLELGGELLKTLKGCERFACK